MGSLSQLLFPVFCMVCEQPGDIFCAACNLKFIRVNRNCHLDEISIWPGAFYGDELARIIVAAKDKNSSPARNFLVQLLVEAFMRATTDLTREARVRLIPIPSSPSSNRRRGFRHAHFLSKSLAEQVQSRFSEPLEVFEALRVNRRIADQSALNKSQRVQNIAGAYSVIPKFDKKLLAGSADVTFLVDDLLTSGSTVQEGVRSMKVAGAPLPGVLCAGVSPRLFSQYDRG